MRIDVALPAAKRDLRLSTGSMADAETPELGHDRIGAHLFRRPATRVEPFLLSCGGLVL